MQLQWEDTEFCLAFWAPCSHHFSSQNQGTSAPGCLLTPQLLPPTSGWLDVSIPSFKSLLNLYSLFYEPTFRLPLLNIAVQKFSTFRVCETQNKNITERGHQQMAIAGTWT